MQVLDDYGQEADVWAWLSRSSKVRVAMRFLTDHLVGQSFRARTNASCSEPLILATLTCRKRLRTLGFSTE